MKKGFTLIELLAVLVVLAILALISIPITIRIIESSRENSYKRSIESYGRTVELAVGRHLIDYPNTEYSALSLSEDGQSIISSTGSTSIEYTGQTIKCGDLTVNQNGTVVLSNCFLKNSNDQQLSKKYDYNNKLLKEVVSYDYHVGDTFTLNGDSYHIIADSIDTDNYVIALKDTPLTKNEIETYGANHINVYNSQNGQVYQDGGIAGIAYYTSETCNLDDESGCINDYDESEIKYVVDTWAGEKFTNELKKVNGYSARLLKYDELGNLGYEWTSINSGRNMGYKENGAVPKWVYSNDYCYWTMSPYPYEDYPIIINICPGGGIGTSSVAEYFDSIRPVINVYKSTID